MTPGELLERNGDFRTSPLMRTARKIHRLLFPEGLDYVIVGGLAVIRNGAVRTTEDVDVLVRKEQWPRIRQLLAESFVLEGESAVDRETGVPADFLFSEDDWNMIVPLPDPSEAAEYDSEIEAKFLSLPAILELKTAVYLQKKREDGIEVAAKDLADVVQLLERNRERVSRQLFETMHPRIRRELAGIRRRLGRREQRRR
jgi:hypothetical protein